MKPLLLVTLRTIVVGLALLGTHREAAGGKEEAALAALRRIGGNVTSFSLNGQQKIITGMDFTQKGFADKDACLLNVFPRLESLLLGSTAITNRLSGKKSA